ncbi:NIPSNAP family protein [Undibacterium sp. CY18W]|uniref:NIPSNAP family protein n=1 Tax=Undibacterium hunanense TaxID=2762292 RepID=A0ABR6ZY48_9BURK|nr:NIPSNAP family protein [Undibacterium hunanense]MBC3920757.1 NIPSNAP family protein [Undibacterium hunanense]
MKLSQPSTLMAAALLGSLGAVSSGVAATNAVIAEECCQVIELRQYVTYPGKRDALISLFETRFIDTQEEAGIRVLAQFRDLNDPYHFTWLRGFGNMEARKQALADFYSGQTWQTYRNDANATLYDNDDVLLLRPASPGSGFVTATRTRAAVGNTAPRGGLVVATIYHFPQEVTADFISKFNHQLMPMFERHGAHVMGRFVTEKSPNTFERLPVRENVNVFVWFASYSDKAAYDHYLASLAQDALWRDRAFADLYKSLQRWPEILMLEPTSRSLLP